MRAFLAGALVVGVMFQPAGAQAAGASAAGEPGPAAMTVSAVKSPSGAAAEVTRAVLRERQRELVSCYQQELANDPEPAVRVTLSFTLRANGSISMPRAEFPDSRLDDAGFAFLGCLTDRVSGWRVRKSVPGSAPVEVGLKFSGARPATQAAQGTPLVGSIGKEAIAGVLQEHAAEIMACYQRELDRDRSLEGKVKLRWTVQADGSVTDVKVDEAGTTLPSRDAVQCMGSRVAGWRFPPPRDGAIAVITNTWALRTQVQTTKP